LTPVRASCVRVARTSAALIAKGDRDFATSVDLQIESVMKASLAAADSSIPFLGEEEGGNSTAQALWVLDPIDGTINFSRDNPLCTISLSLVIDGQPVLGIIDAPLLGERFVAQRGGGAYLNGKRDLRRPRHRFEEQPETAAPLPEAGRVAVFAPSPLLTITDRARGRPRGGASSRPAGKGSGSHAWRRRSGRTWCSAAPSAASPDGSCAA
jgi:fructose-1,6-bisphosphatase/inositol monophosphatase family enzyme